MVGHDEGADRGAVQTVFAALGVLLGGVGALWAYQLEGSYALSISVLIVVILTVGRGVGDVVTDPDKVRRGVYFAILPVLGTVILELTYVASGEWWIALVAGLVGGLGLQLAIGAALFPRIEREELADTVQRAREVFKESEAG